jgi:methylenetetrahydrofolate--tRNA-(uracil-5-)-methyltransferase
LGSLLDYITDPERKRFQPMNVNFGLIPPLWARLRGKAKKEMMARRALADLAAWRREFNVGSKQVTGNSILDTKALSAS